MKKDGSLFLYLQNQNSSALDFTLVCTKIKQIEKTVPQLKVLKPGLSGNLLGLSLWAITPRPRA